MELQGNGARCGDSKNIEMLDGKPQRTSLVGQIPTSQDSGGDLDFRPTYSRYDHSRKVQLPQPS